MDVVDVIAACPLRRAGHAALNPLPITTATVTCIPERGHREPDTASRHPNSIEGAL